MYIAVRSHCHSLPQSRQGSPNIGLERMLRTRFIQHGFELADVGVQSQRDLAHSAVVTPANVHDSIPCQTCCTATSSMVIRPLQVRRR